MKKKKFGGTPFTAHGAHIPPPPPYFRLGKGQVCPAGLEPPAGQNTGESQYFFNISYQYCFYAYFRLGKGQVCPTGLGKKFYYFQARD